MADAAAAGTSDAEGAGTAAGLLAAGCAFEEGWADGGCEIRERTWDCLHDCQEHAENDREER